MIKRLVTAGVIKRVWSYRQAYGLAPRGYHVPLFELPIVAWLDGRIFRIGARAQGHRSATSTASVAGGASVKPYVWWEHSLFGNPGGEPPEGIHKETLRRWRGAAFRGWEVARDRSDRIAYARTP